MNDVQAIANLVNNAIIATWLNGYKNAAKAKIQFSPDKSPFGEQAKTFGMTIFTITAKSNELQSNFPSCMFIVLPTKEVKEILKKISKSRQITITNMENMELMDKQKEEYKENTNNVAFVPDLHDGGIEVPNLPDLKSPIYYI